MKRYIILLLLVAPVLLGYLVVYQTVIFHVTGTSPSNGAKRASAYDDISLSFNQSLASFGSVTANDGLAVSAKIDGKKLLIIPKDGLVIGNHYVIKVTDIVSKTSRHLSNYTLTFDVADIEFKDLSAAAKAKVRALGDKQLPVNPHQGFINSLPYSSAAYDISYITGSDSFLVQIKQAPIDSNRQAAITYLADNGVTQSNARVEFFVLPYLENKPGP